VNEKEDLIEIKSMSIKKVDNEKLDLKELSYVEHFNDT